MFTFRKKVKEELYNIDSRIDTLEELTMRMLRENQKQIEILTDVTKSLDERISVLEKRAR